jgi:hypothetical protein
MYIEKAYPSIVVSPKANLYISVKRIWFMYIERHLKISFFIIFWSNIISIYVTLKPDVLKISSQYGKFVEFILLYDRVIHTKLFRYILWSNSTGIFTCVMTPTLINCWLDLRTCQKKNYITIVNSCCCYGVFWSD